MVDCLVDAILTRFEVLKEDKPAATRFLPFAVEASWITSRWDKLQGYLELCEKSGTGEFNVGMGNALNTLRQSNTEAEAFTNIVNGLRLQVAKSLNANSVASLQSCHDDMLRLHALADVEAIANAETNSPGSYQDLLKGLDRRLDVLGGYLADKQYLLGLRRATMELAYVRIKSPLWEIAVTNNSCRGAFPNSDIASAWLTSAHLSRKGNFTSQAYHSMLHAARLQDRSATIEHARLLWKDGHHRKAIQTLEGAISANESNPRESISVDSGSASSLSGSGSGKHQDVLITARVRLQYYKFH